MAERWQDFPESVKQGEITRQLTLIELQKHEPVFVAKYINLKAQTEDATDWMRLDIALFDKVEELRQEGKISPVEQLRERASGMVDLGPDEMREAFHDYAQEIKL